MLLDDIAARLLVLSYEEAPDLAQITAREGVLDTIGVTLAGSDSDVASRIWDAYAPMSGSGAASVLGGAASVDPLTATMVNGVAAHAHDFDDCSNTLGGHPSAPIVPAIWALGEVRGASGRAVLSAYIAGVETETRIGRAVNFHHYEKGWHPTATLGTFGAAAACAHLMRLDTRRTATALSLAASMASGIKANFGTMAKPFHVGQCARNGFAAALMAEAGVTANSGALEHPQGFFAVYDENNVKPEACLEGWADPMDLVEPGIAFKRHPCCASTHPAIDALLLLREQYGLNTENVSSIRSWTHPRRLKHTNRPNPATGLEAKFSVQYVLACALLRGQLELSDFTDKALCDPRANEIMRRITAEPHPDAVIESTEHFYAEVAIEMTNGETHSLRVERPLGRDRQNPLPEGALQEKFLRCASPIIGEKAAGSLRNALENLEDIPCLTDLAPLLMGAPTKSARRSMTA